MERAKVRGNNPVEVMQCRKKSKPEWYATGAKGSLRAWKWLSMGKYSSAPADITNGVIAST